MVCICSHPRKDYVDLTLTGDLIRSNRVECMVGGRDKRCIFYLQKIDKYLWGGV